MNTRQHSNYTKGKKDVKGKGKKKKEKKREKKKEKRTYHENIFEGQKNRHRKPEEEEA